MSRMPLRDTDLTAAFDAGAPASVTRFDDAPAFARRLCRVGYEGVRYATVPGWRRGIEHTFLTTWGHDRSA